MEHLAARGINCPQPVKNRDGEALGTLAGRPAAIITFLDGMWPRRPNAAHCARSARRWRSCIWPARDFPMTRANALSVSGWRRCSMRPRRAPMSVQHGLRDSSRPSSLISKQHLAAAICRKA